MHLPRLSSLVLVSLLPVLPVLTHATTLDLSSSTSLSSNVNKLLGSALVDDASGGFTSFDVTGSGSSTYVATYTAGGASAATFSTSTSLTVDFDFRVSAASSSIGIYFADASNLNNNVLVLLNVDNSGTTDRFRVFTDGTLSSGSAGSAVSAAQTDASTLVSAGSSDWSSYSITFSVVGTTPTIGLTVGGTTFNYTLASGTADWANTVVALRLSDSNSSTGGIDIQLAAIPEPAIASLLFGLCSLIVVAAQRRRKLEN
jgi:hypothetical protein